MDRTRRSAARRWRAHRGVYALHVLRGRQGAATGGPVSRQPYEEAPRAPAGAPRWQPEQLRAAVLTSLAEAIPPLFPKLTARERADLALASGVVDERWMARATLSSYRAALRAGVERATGGADALAGLDFEPLPDEPFAWSCVPAAVRDRAGEALRRADRCADALFDTEVRTACRRLLADAAAAEPGVLRRGRAEGVAAAVCWAVAKGNGLVGGRHGVTVRALLASCGVSGGVPQRATTVLEAVGGEALRVRPRTRVVLLGSTRYLTARRRWAFYDAVCPLGGP